MLWECSHVWPESLVNANLFSGSATCTGEWPASAFHFNLTTAWMCFRSQICACIFLQVFTPTETINSSLVCDLIFHQILADMTVEGSLRISKKDQAQMKTLLGNPLIILVCLFVCSVIIGSR